MHIRHIERTQETNDVFKDAFPKEGMMKESLRYEVYDAATTFARQARWTLPRIMSGHKVAHDAKDESKVLNFSTITKVVTLSTGDKVFLIYRYPLSWIHSITDNMQRWGSGRPSTKPFRRSTWQKTFEPKSRITTIPINVPGVVAMEYIPNHNLHDVLHHGIGNLSPEQIRGALYALCDQINEMHASGQAWGELIVHNIILKKDGLTPVICDTETTYWPFITFSEQCMNDWRDFIFSVCGANKTLDLQVEMLAQALFGKIKDVGVRSLLKEYCRKPRSLGQKIFWQGFAGGLSLPSAEVYDRIRRAIAHA